MRNGIAEHQIKAIQNILSSIKKTVETKQSACVNDDEKLKIEAVNNSVQKAEQAMQELDNAIKQCKGVM